MGDVMINCTLCCKETFRSKHELIEHLANVLSNLICPICKDKWSTVVHLIEHLSLDNCQQASNAQFPPDSKNGIELLPNHNDNDKSNTNLEIVQVNVQTKQENIQNDGIESELPNNTVSLHTSDDSAQVNKMYVQLLNEQLLKPCLQTQELKLVKEGADRYVILTDDDSILNASSMVVKQNNDGTISMTDKDTKLEIECQNNSTENELEVVQEEYNCNTCGVSFSSVIEHIQNYHNDQDVVVEERVEVGPNELSLEYEKVTENDDLIIGDKQLPRRMITETGDIVEAPIILESSDDETRPLDESIRSIIIPLKEDKIVKSKPSRQYVQSEKFHKNSIKNKDVDDVKGQYHKVIVKEMQTTNGSKIKVFNCMSCNIFVSSLSEFKGHPCKPLKYPCPHCTVAYDNSKSLCAHMKVHKTKSDVTFENPVTFNCAICSTVFLTSKSLKLHKRMHDPIKSRPIEPPVETEEGNAASDDKYICPICFKVIPEDYRAIHESSHNNSNKMNCDICNKKFHSKEYLKMHMTVHNMDKIVVGKQDKSLPYNCLYCNRKFARPHEKVKHERIHTGEKPHTCEICGKAFRVSYCLTLHMRTHTGARPYACPHCGKRFKAHSVYNHHLLTHSDVRAYKCPYCPKAFKTAVQLAGHKNSHTKPFSCQQCNRPFASLYAVRVHTEVHQRQNSLKFSCSLCGASYARAFALRDHVKQVHKDAAEHLKDDEWIVREGDGDVEEIHLDKDLSHEKGDVWTVHDGDGDVEEMHLNKDLSQPIDDMETNSVEMILP